jgi:spectinomycin phosphotransferase
VRYAPVGGGSYHWTVRDRRGERWFVTVDDLGGKAWLGDTPDAVFTGLTAAMDTAVALRGEAGLRFVVAPIPTRSGAAVVRLTSRYAVYVFPFLAGPSGQFGAVRPAGERAELVDLLAALHRAGLGSARVSRFAVGFPLRSVLEAALADVNRPWHGGPYSEPARALVAETAPVLREVLENFDRLAARVAEDADELVITHGEPHPGNVMLTDGVRMLIDWDTVGLAVPERDLWMVVSEGGEEGDRYGRATGRSVNPYALDLYRLRWSLDDASSFLQRLRSPHRRTADTEHAWRSLRSTITGRGVAGTGLRLGWPRNLAGKCWRGRSAIL